jgi:hypothetical protein
LKIKLQNPLKNLKFTLNVREGKIKLVKKPEEPETTVSSEPLERRSASGASELLNFHKRYAELDDYRTSKLTSNDVPWPVSYEQRRPPMAGREFDAAVVANPGGWDIPIGDEKLNISPDPIEADYIKKIPSGM